MRKFKYLKKSQIYLNLSVQFYSGEGVQLTELVNGTKHHSVSLKLILKMY